MIGHSELSSTSKARRYLRHECCGPVRLVSSKSSAPWEHRIEPTDSPGGRFAHHDFANATTNCGSTVAWRLKARVLGVRDLRPPCHREEHGPLSLEQCLIVGRVLSLRAADKDGSHSQLLVDHVTLGAIATYFRATRSLLIEGRRVCLLS
jgi:hypothetical protein